MLFLSHCVLSSGLWRGFTNPPPKIAKLKQASFVLLCFVPYNARNLKSKTLIGRQFFDFRNTFFFCIFWVLGFRGSRFSNFHLIFSPSTVSRDSPPNGRQFFRLRDTSVFWIFLVPGFWGSRFSNFDLIFSPPTVSRDSPSNGRHFFDFLHPPVLGFFLYPHCGGRVGRILD